MQVMISQLIFKIRANDLAFLYDIRSSYKVLNISFPDEGLFKPCKLGTDVCSMSCVKYTRVIDSSFNGGNKAIES